VLTRQQTAAECPELSRHLLGIPNHAALVRQVGNCTAARPALKPDGSPRGSQGFLALNLLPLLADLPPPRRVQLQKAEPLQPQLTADCRHGPCWLDKAWVINSMTGELA
jgi:hypothetical protein